MFVFRIFVTNHSAFITRRNIYQKIPPVFNFKGSKKSFWTSKYKTLACDKNKWLKIEWGTWWFMKGSSRTLQRRKDESRAVWEDRRWSFSIKCTILCLRWENVGKVSPSKSYKTLTKKRKKLIKLRESKSFVAIVAFPCWQKTSSSTYFFSIVLISFLRSRKLSQQL